MTQPSEPIDPARIYTPDEAALILRIPVATLRRLYRQGSLGGFDAGQLIRTRGADLLRFMDDGGARTIYPRRPDDADGEPMPVEPIESVAA